MSERLSVVIITYNEAANIGRCLEAAQNVADEIVVVDSYSTDATEDICSQFNAKFIQRHWEGYAATKNWANAQASSDWILSLDADEVLSKELQSEINSLKEANKGRFFSFNRMTNYAGKWIRHSGWFPDVKLRLFDRRQANWQGDYVHETLRVPSGIDIIPLKGLCYHYSVASVSDHISRVNNYSTLAAGAKFANRKEPSWVKLIGSPLFSFFSIYFLKKGFLDGREGVLIATISSWHRFLREAKLFELWQNVKK